MNKQIVDFALDIHKVASFGLEMSADLAQDLAELGYRKASEGNWVDVYKGKYANQLYKCSVCGNPAYGDGKIWFLTKFCPSCGADMKGEVQ